MSVAATGFSVSSVLDASTKKKAPGVSDAEQDFLNYMKQTPAQRMEDNWLRAHGLTREQYNALSPEEKKKVAEQMRQDIERQMKQAAEGAHSQPKIPSVFA